VSGLRPSPDVAVVGGGIVGTALAAFLAEAGRSVRLYERTAIAAGASGRNSGVVQHPFDPVLAALYHASLGEYRSLADGTGFRLPAQPAGLLYVGRTEARAAELAAEWADAWPASSPEVLVGRALVELEPTLAPDLVACRLRIGFPVGPAAATQAFATAAERARVELVVGEPVGLEIERGRVVGVRRAGVVEPAGQVVVAAGPWSPAIIDPRRSWRPIRPVGGVVASVVLADAPRHGLEAIDIDIEPGSSRDLAADRIEPRDDLVDFSLAPGDGSSALGSTFLPAEPEPSSWVPALRRVGATYVPAIADAPVLGVRHCARPVTLDGRPLVGRIPWLDGLWIAAGHGPWGISTGPGTARMLADALLGDAAGAIPATLVPDRLGVPAAARTGVSARNRDRSGRT
jgi:glycine/D-amino acid oxidase-like deaminating enzyme